MRRFLIIGVTAAALAATWTGSASAHTERELHASLAKIGATNRAQTARLDRQAARIRTLERDMNMLEALIDEDFYLLVQTMVCLGDSQVIARNSGVENGIPEGLVPIGDTMGMECADALEGFWSYWMPAEAGAALQREAGMRR